MILGAFTVDQNLAKKVSPNWTLNSKQDSCKLLEIWAKLAFEHLGLQGPNCTNHSNCDFSPNPGAYNKFRHWIWASNHVMIWVRFGLLWMPLMFHLSFFQIYFHNYLAYLISDISQAPVYKFRLGRPSRLPSMFINFKMDPHLCPFPKSICLLYL